jgi:hypothetical protein
MDGSGSGSCRMADCGMSGVETTDWLVNKLVKPVVSNDLIVFVSYPIVFVMSGVL